MQILASIGDWLKLGKAGDVGPWKRTEGRHHRTRPPRVDNDFVCNADIYVEEKWSEIVRHCGKQFTSAVESRQPMKGTVEGAILIWRLPQFLGRVCAGGNFVRFHLTIKAQVEGLLSARLNDNTPMYANHQTTKRIVDAVMLAARQQSE
ncbi:hypothetical protein PybrP1_011170 [[Pythium] brassicae (nom. inval.)]|nr:hypothetical protein PybrP1_011170 [[Pythium] brassicae (nom. inval.)]